MIKNPKQTIFSAITFVLDIILISIGFFLSYWLRFFSGLIPVTKGIPSFKPYLALFSLVAFIYGVVFISIGVYRSKRILSYLSEVESITKGVILSFLLLMSFSFLYRGFSFSRLVFVIFNLLIFLFLPLNHKFMRKVREKMIKKGVGVKNVVLVGEREKVKEVKKLLLRYPLLGYKIVGSIPLEEKEKLRKLLEKGKVEKLVIISPYSEETIKEINKECAEFNIDFTIVPGIYASLSSHLSIEVLDGIPMIGMKETPLQGMNLWIKRTEDIIISFILLLVASPLFLIVPVLVKLTSRGPVLYSQERIGLDGRPFIMLKFRTMRVDAESETGPVWAKPNDPRRTKLGKFLRRLSLDELPQLLNVLKGEMSLVGPRPERPVFVGKFKDIIPEYMSRHRIKAGITGWAQVNGLRGNTPLENRIKYDLYYLENWSLWFDLRILFLTVFTFYKEAY